MTNLLNFLKEHIWKILTILFLFLFIMKGCTNNKLSNLERNNKYLESKIDSLSIEVKALPRAKNVQDQMERVMLDYLIYEDDLDKGKTSLSDVKNKIESND